MVVSPTGVRSVANGAFIVVAIAALPARACSDTGSDTGIRRSESLPRCVVWVERGRSLYKVNRYYSVDHERGLLWNDPALGISWPVTEAEAILSERDQKHPRLADLPRFFLYERRG